MFGFVRKREVEELRMEVRRLRSRVTGLNLKDTLAEIILDGIREQVGFDEIKLPYGHALYLYPAVSIHKKVGLILDHLKLKVEPEEETTTTKKIPAHLAPRQSPAAKVNKRTAKKANGGDEESGK